MIEYFIILPSLKISGGVIEAYRLAKKLNNEESTCSIVCLWKTTTPITTNNIVIHEISNWKTDIRFAIFQLPIILLKFYLFIKNKPNNSKLIFTHYSTIPLTSVTPDYLEKKIFVQGIEWEFIKIPFINNIFRRFLLNKYKKNNILSANLYIETRLLNEGIISKSMPLWADEFYLSKGLNKNKKTDVLMMIRKGFIKRPDLYFNFLEIIKITNLLQVKIITPEIEIHEKVQKLGFKSFLSPCKEDIKNLYNDSKIFIFLSENEGFGLPPTEAMGSGCIPICRDSGGPSAYMDGPLKDLLFPLNTSIDLIIEKIKNLLKDTQYMNYLGVYCINLFEEKNNIRNKFSIKEIENQNENEN